MAGKIKFVKRGQALAATIQEDDISAHEWGSDVPDALTTVRAQDLELPHEVNVVYINPDADYQQGTQKSERMTGSGVSVLSIPLPIVLSDTKAKQAADVNQFLPWVERTSYQLQLSRKWSKLEPTDVIDVVYNSVTFRMRIVKKDESKGLIKLDCVAEDSAIYTQSGTGAGSSNIPVQVVTIPVQTLAMYLDIPILRDSDNDAGLYFAATGYRSGWSGCALFKSNDNGSTYGQMFSVTDQATIGYATTALGDFFGGNIFDEINSVTVQLISGSLSSATELAVLNGANVAVIGNEIIQFKTATLVATNTYTLTGLLRGRRGTEWAMDDHDIGDRFILASTTTWRRIPLQSGDINLDRLFKSVSFGMTLQQTAAVAVRPTAVGLECFSPVLGGAGRNGYDDIVIEWTRRTRLDGEWRDYVDAALGEATESYEVDIYDDTFTTVLRTLTSTSETVTYTSAQQVTDFGVNQRYLYAKIYQLSSIVGRGYPLTVSLDMGHVSVSATRWRLLANANQGGFGGAEIQEIEMFTSIGGSDECTGGTATSSSGTAANAFDGTSATWVSSSSFPQWVEYEFATAKDILRFSVQAATESSYFPTDFDFQYYNGSTWVTVYSASSVTWSGNQTRYFDF